MPRRMLPLAAMVIGLTGTLVASASVPVVGPTTYTFSAASQSNVWTCNGGQSSFALTVPTGFTGVLTVTVAQTSGGTYSNPPWAYAPGAPGYVNTITNSGSLTVNLGSNLYVKVADTTYTSGSVTVTGGCSAAVAAVPPQVTSVGATSPLASSGGTTPNVSLSGVVPVANGGTGASTLASAPFVVLNPASAQTGTINVTGVIATTSSLGIEYGNAVSGCPLTQWQAGNASTTVAGIGSQSILLTVPGCFNGLSMDNGGDIGILGTLHIGASATVYGPIIQPGYAQHGILSITTPTSCTALSACASGSVTFSTAMTAATYECTANSETYPYVIEISAKTTTAVTFEIYNLVAVSSAQTVPVDYACAV